MAVVATADSRPESVPRNRVASVVFPPESARRRAHCRDRAGNRREDLAEAEDWASRGLADPVNHRRAVVAVAGGLAVAVSGLAPADRVDRAG